MTSLPPCKFYVMIYGCSYEKHSDIRNRFDRISCHPHENDLLYLIFLGFFAKYFIVVSTVRIVTEELEDEKGKR